MRYLHFDVSDDDQGNVTLDAMASTPETQHPAVLQEVQAVLDWAAEQFPHTHGPVDEGQDWDHDLQLRLEDGGWHTVILTLSASPRFAQAFLERFGEPADE